MLHEKIEKNTALLAVLIVVAISFGGLVQIVPLMFKGAIVEPADGVEPYSAIRLAGRDVYVAEGLLQLPQPADPPVPRRNRTLRALLGGRRVRLRPPFQWGSKRTGPDLARVGGLYSDDWHYLHMIDPRAVVPDSNMPAYPWLAERYVDGRSIQRRMRALRRLGHPYSDEEIEGASEVRGVTELEALIAYLQGLGTEWTGQRARRWQEVIHDRRSRHPVRHAGLYRHRRVGVRDQEEGRLRRAGQSAAG
jgi:cytochrome c oxidase cbb3-type subunit II